MVGFLKASDKKSLCKLGNIEVLTLFILTSGFITGCLFKCAKTFVLAEDSSSTLF